MWTMQWEHEASHAARVCSPEVVGGKSDAQNSRSLSSATYVAAVLAKAQEVTET